MTIRKLLENYDKAIAHNDAQRKLLIDAREEVLRAVQGKADEKPIIGRVGCHGEGKRKSRAA